MKFIKSNQKILTTFLLGLFVVGFSLNIADQFVRPFQTKSVSCFFPFDIESVDNKPVELIAGYDVQETNSSPLALMFQLMFILFLISPPIIAMLLFCIWKELKRHNDLK